MPMRPRWAARVVARSLACAVGVVAVVVALPQGTSALLNAKTIDASSTFATTSLYAPSTVTATASGHDVAVGWTAGQNGSGYNVLGLANGSSSTCPASGYSTIA